MNYFYLLVKKNKTKTSKKRESKKKMSAKSLKSLNHNSFINIDDLQNLPAKTRWLVWYHNSRLERREKRIAYIHCTLDSIRLAIKPKLDALRKVDDIIDQIGNLSW